MSNPVTDLLFDSSQFAVSASDGVLSVGHNCGWWTVIPADATLATIMTLAQVHYNTVHRG